MREPSRPYSCNDKDKVIMVGEEPVIRLFNVSKHYNGTIALADVTFDLFPGEFLFVTGPSGAGKSTLVKLLYLGERPSAGSIILFGMNTQRVNRKQVPMLRRKIGVIFQDFKLIHTRTAFQNVALVLEAAGVKSGREIKKRAMHALEVVGLADRAQSMPPTLSGGEQQRVAVARAIVGQPDLILADEPTASLDPESAERIFSLLRMANENGAAVLVTTHDRDLLGKGENRIITLVPQRRVSEKEQAREGSA